MVAGAYDSNFARNVAAVHGTAGVRWLREIPRLVTEIERSWSLEVGDPYDLSWNYVAPATGNDGVACVVKLVPPGRSGFIREATALAGFTGRGAVDLLARDDSRGAMLLERADPGRELAELGPERDGEATAILCSLMRLLWRDPPADHRLPRVADYAADFADCGRRYRDAGPVPRAMVERAAALLVQLSATAGQGLLLHGDLHHHNVLQASREPWLAIDPHGLVGDPGFDVGALLYNPLTLDVEQLLRLLPARLDVLVERTGLDADRVVGWGFVMGVLSEVWSIEDHDEIDGRPLAVAQCLLPLLP